MAGFLRTRLAPLAARLSRNDPLLQQKRFMAADAHGDVKVNCWEAPTEVSKWKEEHIVFAVLGGWVVGIYSAMKIFGGKKAPDAAPAPGPATS